MARLLGGRLVPYHVRAMDTAGELTKEFMGCTACFKGAPVTGLLPLWPPRGWAGPDSVDFSSIMLVSLNPGHPLAIKGHGDGWNEEEVLRKHRLLLSHTGDDAARSVFERAQVTTDAAEDVLAFCRRSYRECTSSHDHKFHKNSVAYAKALLFLLGQIDRVDDGGWWPHCWFTDLVKCSTVRESGKPPPQAAIKNCVRHLDHELAFVKPTIVAALGRKVEGPIEAALKRTRSQASLIRLVHPSPRSFAYPKNKTWERFRAQTEGLSNAKRGSRSEEFQAFLDALPS